MLYNISHVTLQGLLLETVVEEAHFRGIRFWLGSKGSDTAASDIDVLVLSDSVDYSDVFAALQSAEAKLGRTVNPTVYTPANWRKKRKEGNALVVKGSAQPKVYLIGTEEDLA